MNTNDHFKRLHNDSIQLGVIHANLLVAKRWANKNGLAQGAAQALQDSIVTMDKQINTLMASLGVRAHVRGKKLIWVRVDT